MSDPRIRLALLLGLLLAVGPFAIDMYLPAMPGIARDLGATEAATAMTLTAYFLAFGVAQMIWGPMADALGRKVPLVVGLTIFGAATLAAAAAPGIEALIAARAVQGLGAATLMAVPRAVIRDMATGPQAARMMAAIMIVISVSPMLAPLTGSLVLVWGGWREIFAVMGVAAVLSLGLTLFALPETLPPDRRRPFRSAAMASGLGRLLGDARFMGLTMIGGFGMASFFVFLAAASFVYSGHYGLSPTGFSLAFAANAVGFFTASQFAGRLGARYGLDRLILAGVAVFAGTASALAVVVWAGFDALPVVMAGLFVANAGLGLVLPSSAVMALDPHPDIAGLAASLGGTLQMLTGAAMIGVSSLFLDGSPAPMVTAIAVCAVLALGASAVAMPRRRLAG